MESEGGGVKDNCYRRPPAGNFGGKMIYRILSTTTGLAIVFTCLGISWKLGKYVMPNPFFDTPDWIIQTMVGTLFLLVISILIFLGYMIGQWMWRSR
jgi:hypothetical protein